MQDKDLIHSDSIEEINKKNCCAGKYRIKVGVENHCYLENMFKDGLKCDKQMKEENGAKSKRFLCKAEE